MSFDQRLPDLSISLACQAALGVADKTRDPIASDGMDQDVKDNFLPLDAIRDTLVRQHNLNAGLDDLLEQRTTESGEEKTAEYWDGHTDGYSAGVRDTTLAIAEAINLQRLGRQFSDKAAGSPPSDVEP